MRITLINWFELLQSKHGFILKWVSESQGIPPPILKAPLLMNPQFLFYKMILEYSNFYGVPFNELGLVIYFPQQRPK